MASEITTEAQWELILLTEDLRTLKSQALLFITISYGGRVISQGLSIIEVDDNESPESC